MPSGPPGGAGDRPAGFPADGHRRRRLVIVSSAVAAVAVLVAGTSAYLLLRTKGSPQQTAAAYLTAWQRGDHAAMRARIAAPPADFAAQHTRVRTDLGVTKTRFRLGRVATTGDTANAAFTATLSLGSVGEWSYHGTLALVVKDRRWVVAWTPAALHPSLKRGQRLGLTATWPARAAVLAADGTRIDGQGGSVQQLVGILAPATADDLKRLGAPYHKGDTVGRGGIQQTMEGQLAGRPTMSIRVLDSRNRPVGTLDTIPGRPGTPVRTSLDPRIQAAAAAAVIGGQAKPTSLVALRPSTGEILAVANRPGGWNRAIEGRYPPGSTFKVVTAAALLADGLTPADTVACEKTATIGGREFRNFEHEEFGSIDFHTAFAHSCNTAFATQATRRLSKRQLTATARRLGFNTRLNLGVAAGQGGFPSPRDAAEFAAASFGQARVTASPLTMAAVAAAVQDGTWRPPHLVTDPKPAQQAKPRRLEANVVAGLRQMMTSVVTRGTAKGRGLPAGTAGKTGTAEFGAGAEPKTHAWFIGYRGDLAFAVIVEDGGTGGENAAPLVASFLRAL